jgi:hypothetical protein
MSGDLYDRFVAHLTGEGWDVEPLESDEPTFRARVGGESGDWLVYGIVRDGHRLLFYSGGGFVPEERRAAAMELVTRANWGLPVGNFELDLDTGELNFKTSVDLEDVEPSDALLRHLVLTNVYTFDQYRPAIEAVVRGENPAAALAAVES